MDFADVLRQRRSVRAYDGRPVPHDTLERITNAAVVRAPTAGFSQGLRLVVVTEPETRKEIAIAAAEEELAAQGRPRWKAEAPVHVVVLTREADYHERYQQADKLTITGSSEIDGEGLATAIFGVTDVPALRRALGLPDDLHFVAVVTMGYPAEADDASNVGSVFSQRRKQRSEVVRWERWS